MARRALILTVLAAAAGCGQASYSTSTQRGASYLRSGNYDEAIATLSEAIQQNPRDVEALLNRGKAYQYRGHTGDLDRAIEDFTEVIKLAPGDPDAYYNRSMAYRDRGQEGDADLSLADNEAAHKRDPRFSEVYDQIPAHPTTVQITPPPAEEAPADGLTTSQGTSELSGGAASSSIDEMFDRRRRARDEAAKASRRVEAAAPESPLRDDEEQMRKLRQRRAQFKARQAAENNPDGGAAFANDPNARGRDGGTSAAPLSVPPRARPAHRSGEGSPTNRDRFSSGPDFPTIPNSPWQRNPYSAGATGGALPSQLPASRGPRPTGFVEDAQQPAGNFQPQQRTLYDRSLPPVRDPRPTGPNPDDFNGP